MHEIKIHDVYYEALVSGEKKAEIRYNDRDYKVGDRICFMEMSEPHAYRDGDFKITHVCSFIGLKEGYVMLSLERVK